MHTDPTTPRDTVTIKIKLEYEAKRQQIERLLWERAPDILGVLAGETLDFWIRSFRTPEQIVAILIGTEYQLRAPQDDARRACPVCGSRQTLYHGDREVCVNGCQW